MSQELNNLLYEIERRGGSITTYELRAPGMPAQYQRALKQLRERLALKGWTLTFAENIEGQKRNKNYRLIKPQHRNNQNELFQSTNHTDY